MVAWKRVLSSGPVLVRFRGQGAVHGRDDLLRARRASSGRGALRRAARTDTLSSPSITVKTSVTDSREIGADRRPDVRDHRHASPSDCRSCSASRTGIGADLEPPRQVVDHQPLARRSSHLMIASRSVR